MDFVFWQNMPTHHQAPWLRRLAEGGHRVWVAVEGEIDGWRRGLGWTLPDYGAASLEVGISPEKIERVMGDAGTEAVHVFSGLDAYPGVHRAFRACAERRRRIGIMSECPPRSGLHGAAGRAKGMLNRYRYCGSIDFVLGMGEHASAWFTKLGYEPGLLFEFAYHPPTADREETPAFELWSTGGCRLIYIGRLEQVKGVDLALRALAGLQEKDWQLVVVGSGVEETSLRRLTEHLGLTARVLFRGAMRNREAMAAMAAADALLLPSRYEGYGAVVNEALQRGVPVVCSSDAGACQAVRDHPEFGTVFHSPEDLRAQLARRMDLGHRTAEISREVKMRAQCLSPETGAKYFLDIMAHVYNGGLRPAPPWRKAKLAHNSNNADRD